MSLFPFQAALLNKILQAGQRALQGRRWPLPGGGRMSLARAIVGFRRSFDAPCPFIWPWM